MLILVVSPKNLSKLQGLPVTPACLAYRLDGKTPHLFRSGSAAPIRGGLMAIDCRNCSDSERPDIACDEVVRECAVRGFRGVVCDFERMGGAFWDVFLKQLGERLTRRNWTLYLPERYASIFPTAHVMISSAISGGSLEHRLEEAAKAYGVQRITLALQWTAEDFFLPSPAGSGTPLSRNELQEIRERLNPSIFFSTELCSRYFTYRSQKNGVHFVLFDDGDTLKKKLQIARGLGISEVIAAFDEVEDSLHKLIRA